MEPQQVQKMIDESIQKALSFAAKKYGDTPTDALQLVPKKYVSSVVAGITTVPGGSDGQIQYNNSGVFGGDAKLTWNDSLSAFGLIGGALFNQTGSLGNYTQVVTSTTTTDATPVNISIFGTSTNEFGILMEAYVFAKRTGGVAGTVGDSAGYVRRAVFKNIAGVVSLVGSVQDNFTVEDQSGWDSTLAITSTNLAVQVTGAIDNNITWGVIARLHFTS